MLMLIKTQYFRHDSNDPTGVILYDISKLAKTLVQTSIAARNLFCWFGVGIFIAAPS